MVTKPGRLHTVILALSNHKSFSEPLIHFTKQTSSNWQNCGEESGREKHLTIRIQIMLLPGFSYRKYVRTWTPPSFLHVPRGWHQNTTQTNRHTHLSWRRWVSPGARWGWLVSRRPPQPGGKLSAGGQSACVGHGTLPKCGSQPPGGLLGADKRHAQKQVMMGD